MDGLPAIVSVKAKEEVGDVDESKQQVESESFHQAVGPALLFGQLFAMLPVDGVLAKSEENLIFRWRSPRTIYSILFLLAGTIETIVATRRLVRLGFNIHFAESFLFFTTAMARSFFLFRLAMKWKTIMLRWHELEKVFLRTPYTVTGWKLSRKIRVVFGILMAFVIVEHLFFLIKSLEDNRMQLEHCTTKSPDFWQNFLWRYRPHLIYNFPYSPLELPFYEWVNLLQAISWSYSDIFVIVLAVGIKFRFNQFNHRFATVLNEDEKLMTEDNFRSLRVDYYKLIDLVHYIDSQVSTLLLMSLGHNMLVLIVKIFSVFVPNRYHFLDDIYFWFYLFFLLARIFVTLVACASIHDTARQTTFYIRKVPTDFWTIDLKRLFDSICIESSTLTFSGRNFFYVTKSMILTLAGTLVTYELVLLDRVKEDKAKLCSDNYY